MALARPSCLLRPQAGRLFDHGGTIFFSIFMSLWAVLFLEFWKRTNASLAHRWDCSEFEDIEVGSNPLQYIPKLYGQKPPVASDAFSPSFPGAAPAPVHCHGSHDNNKPYNWGRGAIFPQAQPHPSDFGWFGGHYNVGKITRAGEVGCGGMGSV